MSEEEAEAFYQQLIKEGYLREEDRPVWSMIRPERLKRLYQVLQERTRYVSVVLEAVDDGHNQAAVLRSAEAFGIQNISVVVGSAPFQPNKKVTQSAHKWVTIDRKPDIETAVKDLKAEGYQVLASYLGDDSESIDDVDLSKPTALLFGNEHNGISSEAAELADGKFIIPMRGFVQSLNISVAAAVTLYEITRRARIESGDNYYLTPQEKKDLFQQWVFTNLKPRVREKIQSEDEKEGSILR
ncbi:MAG: RNA methyltransferase [Bacillaceae bacterium]|nr:RNA methyltransferase [Bacillaceae bacterium]